MKFLDLTLYPIQSIPVHLKYIPPLILLSFLFLSCGEVEVLEVQTRLNVEEYEQIISPMIEAFDCEICHSMQLGGFRWVDQPESAEDAELNFLNIQRALNLNETIESPLIKRLTPPEPSHPLYFCPNDCNFVKLTKWIESPQGIGDLETLDCVTPVERVQLNRCTPSESNSSAK